MGYRDSNAAVTFRSEASGVTASFFCPFMGVRFLLHCQQLGFKVIVFFSDNKSVYGVSWARAEAIVSKAASVAA